MKDFKEITFHSTIYDDYLKNAVEISYTEFNEKLKEAASLIKYS